MCKAVKYIDIMLNINKEINRDIVDYSKFQSKLDGMQEDILHKIENSNFNASDGYIYAKALKEIREKRRIVKDEINILSSLREQVNTNLKIKMISKNIITMDNTRKQNSINPVYNPRVLKKNVSYIEVLESIEV